MKTKGNSPNAVINEGNNPTGKREKLETSAVDILAPLSMYTKGLFGLTLEKRVFVPLLLLLLAIGFRIGVFRAFADWSDPTATGGAPYDYPCDSDCPGDCPPGNEDDSCSSCTDGSSSDDSAYGMPKWSVREPMMSLWLKDIPLSYQPSHGSRMSFRLLYKNIVDNDQGTSSDIFSFGNNWFSPWRCYMTEIDPDNGILELFNGLGGAIVVTNQSGVYDCIVYKTRAKCNIFFGVPSMVYPSGAVDIFGYTVTNSDYYVRHFLTKRTDANNNTTTFTYTNYNGVLCLASITDVDGKATTFTYSTSGYYTKVSQVTDPYGHTATLQYYGDDLIQITDSAAMSSSITYGNPMSLVTPYGTNTFTVFRFGPPVGVHVNELGLRDHLYMYVDIGDTNRMTNSFLAKCPVIPAYSTTFDTINSHTRNSFYWGPLQYSLLSSNFVWHLTNGVLSTTYLYNTNFLQARQRHWLMQTNSGTASLGQTLSLETAPSPDGVTRGQITWYDYDNKIGNDPEVEGTMILPTFKAWLLPNGQTRFIRYERNILGHPTNIIESYSDASGNLLLRTNSVTFLANNIDVCAITNAMGVLVSSNVFNAYHQVLTNYNALGEMTTHTYDNSNRVTSITYARGLVTTNIYGADCYLSQTIDLGFRTNTYSWLNGLVYSHTDPRGLTVTNAWDGLNRLVSVTYPDGTCVSNTYNNLDLVQTVDRTRFTNRYVFNGLRQMTQRIDALNRTNNYGYCNCGILNTVTDPLNNTTTFYYDLQGHRAAAFLPDSTWVSNQFDLAGQLIGVSDSGGASITNWYNNRGLLVAVSNAFGLLQSIAYDVNDRITNSVNVNGVSVNMTYDNLGRIHTCTYPDNGVEQFGYTFGVRNMTSYTNQLNQPTHYVYDAESRITAETNANLEVTQFAYDGAGDLLTLTDGKNDTTSWHYDQFGRVTNKVDAANNVLFIYKYDPDNRLTNRWSAAKGTTVYSYDSVRNLTNIDYSGGTVSTPSVTLIYDPLNRPTNMLDGVGTTVYSYDAAGQMLSEDGPWANDTVSYTYANRLRKSMTLLQPSAATWTNTYGYDVARRLTSVTSPAGTFSYILGGAGTASPLISSISLPGGSYITNTYDSVARLLSTRLLNSGGWVLDSESYTYNQGNQRAQQVFTAGNYDNYTYDDIGQLKTAIGKEASGTSRLQEQLGYTYDAADNLNFQTNNALVQTFSVNNLNELSTLTRSGTFTVAGTASSQATNVTVNTSNAVQYSDFTFASTNQSLADGNNTFTAIAKDSFGNLATNVSTAYLPTNSSFVYDLNGNLCTNNARIYEYDDENRLIRITVTNSWKSEFVYDGRMRRRIRKEYTWQSGAWVQTNEVHYVYDGNVVIQERDTNNAPQVTYTRGNDLSGTLQRAGGIGGLLARSDTNGPAYYHADGDGNVTMMVNTNRAIVAKYEYDSFGNILSQSGILADANLFRFSSKELHLNSGLIYYLYRFYDPNLQRWLNRDPIMELGGINLYGFVFNNPLCYIDEYGMVRWGQLFTGVGSLAGGLAAIFVGAASSVVAVGIPVAVSGVIATGYGIGNIVSAFSSNAQAAQAMQDSPSNLGGAVGAVIGGEEGQNIGSVFEDLASAGAGLKSNDLLDALESALDALNESLGLDKNAPDNTNKPPCNPK